MVNLRTQIFSPDSCGCVVNEQYDLDNPDLPHIVIEYLAKCNEHTHPLLDTDSKIYQTMLKENNMKNIILNHLLTNNVLPTTMLDTVDSFDPKTHIKTTSNALHKNVIYNYFFTGSDPTKRQITFSLEGLDKVGNVVSLTNAQKTSVANLLSTKLGSNRVQYVDQLHTDLLPAYKAAIDNRNSKNYTKATRKFREPTEEEKNKISILEKMKDFVMK